MNPNGLPQFRRDINYQGPHIIMSYLKKQKSRTTFKIFGDQNTRYFTLNMRTFEFFYTEKDQYSSKDIKKIDLENVKYVMDKGCQKDSQGQVKEWSYQISICFKNKYTNLFCQNEKMQQLWLYAFKHIIKLAGDQPLYCQPDNNNDQSKNNNINDSSNNSKKSNSYIDISNLQSQSSQLGSPRVLQNNSQNIQKSQQSIQSQENKNIDDLSVDSNSRKDSFESQSSLNSLEGMQRKKSRSLFKQQHQRRSIFSKQSKQHKFENYWNQKVIPVLKRRLQQARNNLNKQDNNYLSSKIIGKTQKEEDIKSKKNQNQQQTNLIEIEYNETQNFGMNIQNKMNNSNSCRVLKNNEIYRSPKKNFIQSPRYFSSKNKQKDNSFQSKIEDNNSNSLKSSSKDLQNENEQTIECKKENLGSFQQRQNMIKHCFFEPENKKSDSNNEEVEKNHDDFNINSKNLLVENNDGIKQIPFKPQFSNNLRNNIFNQYIKESDINKINNNEQSLNSKRRILFSPKPRKHLLENYFKSPQSRPNDISLQQSSIKHFQKYNLKTEVDYNNWDRDDFKL